MAEDETRFLSSLFAVRPSLPVILSPSLTVILSPSLAVILSLLSLVILSEAKDLNSRSRVDSAKNLSGRSGQALSQANA